MWLKRHRWLLLILLVSLGFRAVIGADRDRWPLTADEADWERQGLIYATHGLGVEDLATYKAPLYPLLISVAYRCFGTETVYVRHFQALLFLVTTVSVYALSTRLVDRRTPITAACVASIYPLWAMVNTSVVPGTLLTCLAVVCSLQAVRIVERPSLPGFLLLGLLLGAAILCDPVLALWVPVVVLLVTWHTSMDPARVQMNRLAAVVAGLLLVIAPWTIRNEAVTGHRLFWPPTLGRSLLIGHEPRARGSMDSRRDYVSMYERMGIEATDQVEKDRLVFRTVTGWIVDDPGRALVLAARKVWVLWNSVLRDAPRRTTVIHFLSGSAIAVFGLVGVYRQRRHLIGKVAGSVVLVWTLYCAVFYASPAMRLPIDLCLLPLAAMTGLRFFDWVKQAVIGRFRELEAA